MNETTRSMMGGTSTPNSNTEKANDEIVKARIEEAEPKRKDISISHKGVQFQIYPTHTTVFIGDTVITLS